MEFAHHFRHGRLVYEGIRESISFLRQTLCVIPTSALMKFGGIYIGTKAMYDKGCIYDR